MEKRGSIMAREAEQIKGLEEVVRQVSTERAEEK